MSQSKLSFLIEKLPHRSSMLLIDNVEEVDASSVVVQTVLDARRRILFGPEGVVESYIGVELVAQAAAIPLIFTAEEEKEHSGMIVQVRTFESVGRLTAESRSLTTKCAVEFMLDGRVAVARGEVFCEGEPVCSAVVTLAVRGD